MTIPEASKRYGIKYMTLWCRVLKHGLKPLVAGTKTDQYDAAELMRIAFIPKNQHPPRVKKNKKRERKSGDTCICCGKKDSGNSVRGGLCLECWCHDYCIEHGL